MNLLIVWLLLHLTEIGRSEIMDLNRQYGVAMQIVNISGEKILILTSVSNAMRGRGSWVWKTTQIYTSLILSKSLPKLSVC